MNEPTIVIPPAKGATKISDLAAGRLIAYFDETGYSAHSPQRASLQIVLDHCHEHGIPYEVSNAGGRYFVVRRIRDSEAARHDMADDPQALVSHHLQTRAPFRAVYRPRCGISVERVLEAGAVV